MPKLKSPSIPEPVVDDSAAPGEMSMTDSAKYVKLKREMQRAGIDLSDAPAAVKFATEKLGMPLDQAQCVVKFAKSMQDRKAIMDGGIDAILNSNSRPQIKTTPSTAPQRSAPANVPEVNSNSGAESPSNPEKLIDDQLDSVLSNAINPLLKSVNPIRNHRMLTGRRRTTRTSSLLNRGQTPPKQRLYPLSRHVRLPRSGSNL